MLRIVQTYYMTSGTSRSILIPVRKKSDGTPKNLTGATIVWKLALSRVHPDILTKTLADGLEIIDYEDTNDAVRLTLIIADTEDLAGLFYHSLFVTDAADQTDVVAEGDFHIFPA